jgi:hypothetical protein
MVHLEMVHLEYAAIFTLLLAGLIGSLSQVSVALENADMDRFFIWACIATSITGMPMILWS